MPRPNGFRCPNVRGPPCHSNFVSCAPPVGSKLEAVPSKGSVGKYVEVYRGEFFRQRVVPPITLDTPTRSRSYPDREPCLGPILARLASTSRGRFVAVNNVRHGNSFCQKVVGNDPAMTTPPDRLGTHDSAVMVERDRAQFIETTPKRRCFNIVRVACKQRVVPEWVTSCESPAAGWRGPPRADRRR